MELPVVTNKIELGHIVQAGVIVFTVGGAVLGGYLAIENQVGANNQNIAILQQQQTQTVKWMQQIQDEQQAIKKDMNVTLNNITERLTELRIVMAKVLDGQHK